MKPFQHVYSCWPVTNTQLEPHHRPSPHPTLRNQTTLDEVAMVALTHREPLLPLRCDLESSGTTLDGLLRAARALVCEAPQVTTKWDLVAVLKFETPDGRHRVERVE